MTLLTEHDFETQAGQKRIILTIHSLETKVHELNRLMHECVEKVQRLETDREGYEKSF